MDQADFWLCQHDTIAKTCADQGCREAWATAKEELSKRHPTRVVNLYDGAPYDVFVGRPSKWGNPFALRPNITRESAVKNFARYILEKPELLAAVGPELKGKTLGCYCAPLLCHGMVLARLADHGREALEQWLALGA